MELKDYLKILRRNLVTFVLVAGLVIAGNFYLIRQQPIVHEARAQIILKEPPQPWVVYTATTTPPVWESLTQATRLSLIESEPVLRRALKALPIHFPLPASAFEEKTGEKGGARIPGADEAALFDAMDSLRHRLSVDSAKDTEIVSISARDRDPELVRDICNAVAVAFSEYIDVESRRRFDDTLSFLESQEKSRRGQVDALEVELEKHKSILDAKRGPGDPGDLPRELGALRMRWEDLSSRLDEKKAAAEPIRAALKEGRPFHLPPEAEEPSTSSVRTTITDLQAELEGLLQRYTEKHPKVVDLRRRLDVLKTAEEFRATTEAERYRQRAAFRLERAKHDDTELLGGYNQETKALSGRLDDLAKEMEGLKGKIIEAGKDVGPKADEVLHARQQAELLGYQLDIAKRGLSYLIDRRADLDLQRNLQAPSVQIVSPAKLGVPIGKGGAGNWVFVVLIGFMVGIAGAYVRDYMNTTIRTEHDVKRYLNLPVLGSILRLGRSEPHLLLDVPPKTPLHELFNTIGALIEAYASEKQDKVFTVTSSRPEEGKSTITSNIGIALARSGERVVLIDCDLRKPALHRFFALDNSVGMSILAERAQARLAEQPGDFPMDLLRAALLPTAVENLRVLPAGPHCANPVSLLKSDFFRELLKQVRAEADLVLVDVPPANLAVDTMLVAPRVDGVVLLISAGEVAKEEATYAKRLVESAHGKLIGCVLNKVTMESHPYYYYPRKGESKKQAREG